MLVQMALTSLMRFDDEMVMPPEMKFSKREREIEMDCGREDVSGNSDHSLDLREYR
jgi:hypothetical protein